MKNILGFIALIFLLVGCFRFDLSPSAIEKSRDKAKIVLQDRPTNINVERIHWIYYYNGYITDHLLKHDGCAFIYIKHELSCGECDKMDLLFKDKDIVSLLNNNFLPVKITDDIIYWDRAIETFNVKITPKVIIYNSIDREVLFVHEGVALSGKELVNILGLYTAECEEQE